MVTTRSSGSSPMNNNGSKPVGMNGKAKQDDKNMKKTMLVVFVSLLLDLLAFTMILPLLPAILDYYGKNDDDVLYNSLRSSVTAFRELVGAPDTTRWNGVLYGGLIGSMFSFLQFMVCPIIGALSDVHGRRPVLLLSLVGVAASYALWAVSKNFTMFVLARVLAGLSKGNVSISTAVVVDVMPLEKRGKGMAVVGIAFSVAFLLGPMIGAYFSVMHHQGGDDAPQGFVVPALFALGLAVLNIIFSFLYFKETLPEQKRAKSLKNRMANVMKLINPVALFKFSAVDIKNKKDADNLKMTGLVYFLYLFIYSGLEFTLTFLVHNNFNYNSMQQGKMFFFIGLIMICIQGAYVRRLERGSEQKLAIRGLVLLIPGFIIVGMATHVAVLYFGLVFFAFASSTVVPCLTTLVSNYGSVAQKGTITGIFRSLGALARALGPIFASTIFWCAGSQVCYCIGAMLFLLPLLLLKRTKISHTE